MAIIGNIPYFQTHPYRVLPKSYRWLPFSYWSSHRVGVFLHGIRHSSWDRWGLHLHADFQWHRCGPSLLWCLRWLDDLCGRVWHRVPSVSGGLWKLQLRWKIWPHGVFSSPGKPEGHWDAVVGKCVILLESPQGLFVVTFYWWSWQIFCSRFKPIQTSCFLGKQLLFRWS